MDALKVQRRILKGQVTRITNAIETNRAQGITSAFVKIQSDKLDRLTTDLEQLQQHILLASSEEKEEKEHIEQFDSILNRIDAQKAICLSLLPNTSASGLQASRTTSDIKLPKLELPTFDGSYDSWLPFHDIFIATIHENTKLSSAQKFQYLKAALKGEAAFLVHSIPVTNENYSEAWEILSNRFNNTREIIDAHVSRLFSQPKIQLETAATLRRLLDTTTECVRALKVLKVPVENWDVILVFTLKSKMDPECRRNWELSLVGSNQHSFADVTTFLENRARALAAAQAGAKQAGINKRPEPNSLASKNQHKTTVFAHLETNKQSSCIICDGSHLIFRCPEFLKASITERRKMVRDKKLCFNCLRSDHYSTECKSGQCKRCHEKHNTLLHNEVVFTNNDQSQTDKPEVVSHVSHHIQGVTKVLLATALVQIKNNAGRYQTMRALLDSGSQSSFISERCVQTLGLQRQRANVCISGIGSTGIGTARGSVNLAVKSKIGTCKELTVNALILAEVTKPLPSFICEPDKWSHLRGLPLADPEFHLSRPVDVLLGADIYVELLDIGLCQGESGTPSAFNTIFGWVISGADCSGSPETTITVHHVQCSEDCLVDNLLPRFWELEEIPTQKPRTAKEEFCEQHFAETHSRDTTGRYMVKLPFQRSRQNFQGSRDIAVNRFLRLEQRLQAIPELGEQYRQFMDEYIQLGHMELVNTTQGHQDSTKCYYLPHHAVVRPTSTTRKLRVVFDASARALSGVSLNAELLVGPKLQEDLFNLLIRFRSHTVALTADIVKMFRQVRVDPEDADFQRIVWRKSPQEPLQDYRLLTVTYGTASAPYLATRVLQQLARDKEDSFPRASAVVLQDLYMDDLLTGAETSKSASEIQQQLVKLLHQGGFQLHKWASNDLDALESIPLENRAGQEASDLKVSGQNYVQTLGLRWHTSMDQFSFLKGESTCIANQ